MHLKTYSEKINKLIKEIMIFYQSNTQVILLLRNDSDFKTATMLIITSKIIHLSVKFTAAILIT